MIIIKYYDVGDIENDRFKYAIICASYKEKWIFVRESNTYTWGLPAGHREQSEDICRTASRELYEETGALQYDIRAMFDYSVSIKGITKYGRVFYAIVYKIGHLPDSEIEEISFCDQLPENLRYGEVQRTLFNKVLEALKS